MNHGCHISLSPFTLLFHSQPKISLFTEHLLQFISLTCLLHSFLEKTHPLQYPAPGNSSEKRPNLENLCCFRRCFAFRSKPSWEFWPNCCFQWRWWCLHHRLSSSVPGFHCTITSHYRGKTVLLAFLYRLPFWFFPILLRLIWKIWHSVTWVAANLGFPRLST